jgi:nickel superoxide dismutase
MTKKILDLDPSDGSHATANTLSRFIAIKEQEAHAAKEDLLVLWTDYFKPPHLEKYPDLHTTFWNAAKLCSTVKVEVNLKAAEELMATVQKIHEIFWDTKGKDVPWVTAS